MLEESLCNVKFEVFIVDINGSGNEYNVKRHFSPIPCEDVSIIQMAHTPLQDFLLCMLCFLRSIFYLLFVFFLKRFFMCQHGNHEFILFKFSQMPRYRLTLLDEHIVVILPLELADVQYICVKTNIHRCGWIWVGNCEGNLRSPCFIFFGYVFCNTPRFIRVFYHDPKPTESSWGILVSIMTFNMD